MRSLVYAVAAMVPLLLSAAASAQNYPLKPVKILVGFAPGGTVDAVGRAAATALTQRFGQTFFVENKPGAGGLLALQEVAKSSPDGYVIGVGSSGPLTVSPSLFKTQKFEPLKSLAPIIRLVNAPGVVITKTDLGADNVDKLISLSKERSLNLSMASAGTGSMPHMMGEFFQMTENVTWTHIPYKGSSPALLDLSAGRVDVMIDVMPVAVPLIKSGKLKALAVTTAKRSTSLPDIPTLKELGYSYDMGSWMGVVAPKGVPSAVIEALNSALNDALKNPDFRSAMENIGVPVGGTSDDFESYITSESARWNKIIDAKGIKID